MAVVVVVVVGFTFGKGLEIGGQRVVKCGGEWREGGIGGGFCKIMLVMVSFFLFRIRNFD
jgi:hypothetical protein